MASTAYLLVRQYLPTVRLEYPPQPTQPQAPPSPATLDHSLLPASISRPLSLVQQPASTATAAVVSALPSSSSPDPGSHWLQPLRSQQAGAGMQPSAVAASAFSSSSSSSSPSTTSSVPSSLPSGSAADAANAATADRLGLRSLESGLGVTDIRTEELLLRGVSDVRSELSDIATQLKEQAQDNRRILTALQQTIDSMGRERRDEHAAMRARTAQLQHRDSKESQGQTGGETPASPRSLRMSVSTIVSSPSASSPSRDRLPPSIDTAPVEVRNGSGWALTNGRDSPRSASSSSNTPTLTAQPMIAPSSPSAVDSSLSGTAVPVSPTATLGSQQSTAVDLRLHAVSAALENVRSSNNAQSALSALSSLAMYVSNVSPLHEKCRKVQLSNYNYQQRIAKVQGAQDVLAACGFQLRGKALEWKPTQDSDADSRLLTEAREAMTAMQAAIAAQQHQQQQHSDEADTAAASPPLASPLPSSATSATLQSMDS